MKRLTQEEYIKKASQVHNNKYSYEKLVYVNMSTPVTIICPIHKEFVANTNNHLYNKAGCPKCGRKDGAKIRRKNFVKEAQIVHGNRYSYLKTRYQTLDIPVTITCKIHGDFLQLPRVHLDGHGCKLCSGKKWDTQHFILASKETFGLTFSYDNCHYTGYDNELTIRCTQHGEFVIKASKHLSSKYGGCKKCYLSHMRLTQVEFITRATKVNPDYDYSRTVYKTMQDKVEVICPKHGGFVQTAANHLLGNQKCPKCVAVVSKPHQKIIDYLTTTGIEFEVNVRNILLSGKELDIYIPSKMIAIEVDGVWFHSSRFQHNNNYHQQKQDEAASLGIRLYQFWDFEVNDKFSIVQSMLDVTLGLIKVKVGARKTVYGELTSTQYANFLQENHIQGPVQSAIKYGLFYKGEIILVLGATTRNNTLVLDRFASKRGVIVMGGFSKLLSKLPKTMLITHSANRYSGGRLYQNIGFTLVSESPKTLYYTDGVVLYSRNKFQKHKIKDLPGYNDNKTANQVLEENGIFAVYGAGTKTWAHFT